MSFVNIGDLQRAGPCGGKSLMNGTHQGVFLLKYYHRDHMNTT